MNFTFEDLDTLRKEGYTDDQISSVLQKEDPSIGEVLKEGYTLDQITSTISGKPMPEPEPREFFSFEDAVSAIGTIPEALAVGVPAAYQKLVTGLEIPEKSEAIESELAFQQRIQTEQADRVASGKATTFGSAIREALPSLGFSVLPMAAAIPAGIGGTMVGGPAAPVTGPAAAMAASGTVAYRMAGSDMMYRAYKQLEEAKGSPLTNEEKAEYYKTVLPIAQNYGLWEAGPEAVSNAITMGVGKFVFGFGKQAAKKLVGESIDSANKTIARKVAEKGAAVAGGLGTEIASEGVTSVGQYPEEAKIRQLAATGEVSQGEPPSYPGGYMQAVRDVAPATIALYGMMGTAAGGAKLSTLPFRSQKTPEQIAEDNINLEADRVSRELSIGETDEETKSINAALQTARNNLIAKKEVYTALEPNDPAAQSLGLEIREMEREVVALDNELKKRIGQPLSEPITEAEKQQIELAKAITTPATSEVAAQPTTKTGKQIDPELTNSIGKMVGLRREGGLALEEGYAYRSVGEGEVGSIVQEGYMVTDPKLIGKAKKPRGQVNQKMFSEFNQDAPNAAYGKGEIVIRAKKENVPTGTKGEAVRENDVEVLTYNGNEWIVQTPAEFAASRNLPTTAPVEQVVTPPVETAPTIAEAAPVEPITPAPVTEQAAPAEAPTPEVAPIQRDVENREQMTPEEASVQRRSNEKNIILEDGAGNYISKTSKGYEVYRLEATNPKRVATFGLQPQYLERAKQRLAELSKESHSKQVALAAINNRPVSASAVESYGINLPEGYAKQGDLYVYQPIPAVSETITEPAATPAQAELAATVSLSKENFTPPIALPDSNNVLPRSVVSEAVRRSGNPPPIKPNFVRLYRAEPSNMEVRVEDPSKLTGVWWTNSYELASEYGDRIYYADFPKDEVSLGNDGIVIDKKGKGLSGLGAKLYEPGYFDLGLNKKSAQQVYGLIMDGRLEEASKLIDTESSQQQAEAPTGIAVGNRIKLGKSPQTYTIEEVIPQSANDKKFGEQYYSVKNEKTGETQVVEKNDMKPVSSRRRKMAAEPEPLPENERYGQVKLNRRIQKYFGGKIPDKVYVVDNTDNKEYQYKAAYYPDLGILVVNNAYVRKGENVGDIIAHELGHYAFGDKKFKDAFDNFYNSLSPEDKAKIDNIIEDSYNEETEESQIEESKVIAFTSYTIVNPQRRSLWNAVLDALKAFANKVFGKNFQMSDPNRTALAMLATAKRRFAAGEEIVREEEAEGPRKMAARREQIMGEKVGPEVKTPEGIIAKTQELLRKQFDPTKVTEQNTTEAFRAIGRLTSKQGNAFAEELNDLGRVEGSEVSMGAALFVNDLFEYSIRLAAEGQKMMLGVMMTNINKLPTGAMGATGAGQTLRARLELSQRFLTMAQAEQDSYTNYVAEFMYGPNPTKEQIQSIKDAYAAVEKTQQITEEELTDEITAVGNRTGTDLVGRINEEFTKATEKSKEKRKTEEEELDTEYKKVQKQADAEIEKLAKIQSDTPSFDPAAARQITNDVRAIVANDLKQNPDMGRKAPWKSMLVAKLQEAGVELTAAETLADIVWRQHEINSLSRELSSINKAIEKGPISEIIKAIKETPLEDQQKPNWRYEVMRDYLRKAGLPLAQAERIAKLMDISLQKRFTMAQEQAFTDAISKSAPWKSGDTRSRRAFQKVLQALRAGALDPARNVLSDMAALNGWTGFTPEQYKALLKNDAILSDPESADATKAEAHKAIQDIISKAKLPIRARDVIGQFYDAQALSGIPTMTVNIFSPAGMAVKNALTQSLNGLLTARPEQITAALTTFIDSIKSWANTVAFSFKNNVTVYSNVEYLVNDEGLLKLYKRGVDQFNKGKTPRERADGVKNMMIGMMDYVRRVLNALDYGAIASLQNQAVSKYALAAMQAKGMSSKDGAKMLNAMMEQKRIFYNDQIAIGTDKNKAAVLADEFFISSWRQALTDAKLPAQQVMDAALNDAMSAVGRNRQSLDAFREEETNTRDGGVISYPALWLLETMANAANKADNQVVKLFSRMIYGFAVVPARVFRETAWFSPYGGVRFAYDYIAKKMGKTSPYAQSLGNDLQYRQRLTETITGSIVLLGFAAAMSSSTEDEEDEKPFKIVVTGNGPLRSEDPQYYDSWTKKHKANTVSVYFGKTKFTINTMRGFEAFAWPAMMLGAVDDWQIRRKQKRETNTPAQMGDAAIIGGFVLSASLRRGPYAFAAKPLFEAYGDRGVESLAKSLAFPAKTLVPVLGSSLAKNFSDFLNEPVDRKTLEGALWANVPFIGPAVSPKSLNAFGEPALANETADKIFKLGVPIIFNIPTDRDSVNLHELVLKQGGGPSIPTRNQLAQRLDRQPTNKEYEMFVKEYGTIISTRMKKGIDRLSAMTPERYSKVVERIGNNARDAAERKVRLAAKKP